MFENLKFDNNGLIVVIVQDVINGEVLMQAYANKEALTKTIETGFAYYFSRSRNKLWKKGEESGNLQKIYEILYDCDGDSLLYLVEQVGSACHTNNRTCFYRSLTSLDHYPDYKILFRVADTIKSRALNPKEGSYTNYLLTKGIEKICKKVGEESTEAVIAAIANKKEDLVAEIGDLFFHLAVLMESMNIQPSEIFAKLEEREGLVPKEKYKDLSNDKKIKLN